MFNACRYQCQMAAVNVLTCRFYDPRQYYASIVLAWVLDARYIGDFTDPAPAPPFRGSPADAPGGLGAAGLPGCWCNVGMCDTKRLSAYKRNLQCFVQQNGTTCDGDEPNPCRLEIALYCTYPSTLTH